MQSEYAVGNRVKLPINALNKLVFHRFGIYFKSWNLVEICLVYREDHFGKAIFKIEAMQYKLWNKLRQANEVSLVSYKCPYNLVFNRF